jgi:hypothetical protein
LNRRHECKVPRMILNSELERIRRSRMYPALSKFSNILIVGHPVCKLVLQLSVIEDLDRLLRRESAHNKASAYTPTHTYTRAHAGEQTEEADRQVDRHRHTQRDRQIDRQTQKPTEKGRERDRSRYSLCLIQDSSPLSQCSRSPRQHVTRDVYCFSILYQT